MSVGQQMTPYYWGLAGAGCGWWGRWGATEGGSVWRLGGGGGTLATGPSLASSTGSSVPSPASPASSHNLTPLSPYNIPPSTQHPAVNISPYLSPYTPRDSTISHHVAINLLFIFTRMQLANVNE